MDPGAFENFLLIPSPENSGAGTCYELSKSKAFKKNSFVIIPYRNPQVQIPKPEFYKIKSVSKINIPQASQEQLPRLTLQATTSRENYLDTVKQLKTHIQLGNIYEINYCVQFSAENISMDPLVVFARLQQLARAPYAKLLKLGTYYIISASPELFLEKKGEAMITKPIKGTTRRGQTKEEDETLKQALHHSIKERTENVMAVDVARNDLSQFAQKGSVQVNRLYNIETFETVHQMVSTVSCRIKAHTSFEKIIESTFPMASMTGAPKLRAMTLIDESEDFDRRYYSGAMGLIDAQEDYTLSVNIRSIFYNAAARRLSICVGGAITYLSDPEKEYEECLLKANALLKALNAVIG